MIETPARHERVVVDREDAQLAAAGVRDEQVAVGDGHGSLRGQVRQAVPAAAGGGHAEPRQPPVRLAAEGDDRVRLGVVRLYEDHLVSLVGGVVPG